MNEGPSPTISPKVINFYVPILENIRANISEVDNGITCNNPEEIGSVSIGDITITDEKKPISCEDRRCNKFQCVVEKGWEKHDSHVISIKMKFLGQNINPDDFSDFIIFTAAQIDDKGKKTSKFFEG